MRPFSPRQIRGYRKRSAARRAAQRTTALARLRIYRKWADEAQERLRKESEAKQEIPHATDRIRPQ